MLTAPELLTLIKAHNILSKIKVPAKARKDAGALEKIINEANYKVDHDKKAIKPMVKRGKQITLKSAEELTKPKVDPEVSKAKREAKKAEKEVEKKKELKLAKKEAVKEFKTKQKEGKKKAPSSILKDKNLSKSIEMKGEEKQLADFYGKTEKKYEDPPATKQPTKKAPVKKAPVKKEEPVDKTGGAKGKEGQLSDLLKKLNYKNLPYPAELLDSDKMKNLKEQNKKLTLKLRNAKGSKKSPIMTEMKALKKLIDTENKEMRKNPKKLSKDEEKLLELISQR